MQYLVLRQTWEFCVFVI